MNRATTETEVLRKAGHVLRWDDDDADLIIEIARVMCIALDQGNAVMCIATPEHQQRFEHQLGCRGIDVAAARSNGQFVCMDAAERLDEILTNDRPDATLFANSIGAAVDRITARDPRIWIYSEMGAVLSVTGNLPGAAILDQLWSAFIAKRTMALYCAYPGSPFESHEDLAAFVAVCHTHCRLLHAETALATEGRSSVPRRPRVDAPLQQGCAAGS